VGLALALLGFLRVLDIVGQRDRLALDAEKAQGAGRHDKPVSVGDLAHLRAATFAVRGFEPANPVKEAMCPQRRQRPHHSIAGSTQPFHEEGKRGLKAACPVAHEVGQQLQSLKGDVSQGTVPPSRNSSRQFVASGG
jgi:hypothetical protein